MIHLKRRQIQISRTKHRFNTFCDNNLLVFEIETTKETNAVECKKCLEVLIRECKVKIMGAELQMERIK